MKKSAPELGAGGHEANFSLPFLWAGLVHTGAG